MNDIRVIWLTRGYFTIVDAEDYDYLMRWKWCYNGKGYAVRSTRKNMPGRKTKTIPMHREINRTPEGMDTDHRNGFRLDNRKSNLRTATPAQNAFNSHSRHKYGKNETTSHFKGVSWVPSRKKWLAQTSINGKNCNLGRFDKEIDAAEAFNNASVKAHGEFAVLNPVTR